MVQEGCTSASHHVPIPASKKQEGGAFPSEKLSGYSAHCHSHLIGYATTPGHKETRNTISSCDQVLLPEKKGSLGISRQPATFAEGFGSPSQKSGHQPAPRGPAGCAAGGWGSGPPATSASPLPPWDEPPKGRPVHAPIPTLPSCILPLLLGSRPHPGQLTQARTEGSE